MLSRNYVCVDVYTTRCALLAAGVDQSSTQKLFNTELQRSEHELTVTCSMKTQSKINKLLLIYYYNKRVKIYINVNYSREERVVIYRIVLIGTKDINSLIIS